jgi:hypothetical protein
MVKSTARTADESAHNPAGCPAGAAEPAEHNHLETMRCGVTRVQYPLCHHSSRSSRSGGYVVLLHQLICGDI